MRLCNKLPTVHFPHDLPRQSHSRLLSPARARLGTLLALCRQPLRKGYSILFASVASYSPDIPPQAAEVGLITETEWSDLLHDKNKSRCVAPAIVFIAGRGFEPPVENGFALQISRSASVAGFLLELLIFSLLALPSSATGGGRARSLISGHPKLHMVQVFPEIKKQSSPNGLLCFFIAGRGFEPPDLRVMSPTS